MEQFWRKSTRNRLDLRSERQIGRGGEATVYALNGDPLLVAKIYHPSVRSAVSVGKLTLMVENPPDDPMARQGHASIAWPSDLVLASNGALSGYLMPRVSGMRPIIDYYQPGMRRRLAPLFTWQYLLRTARNLAAAMHALHLRGYVVGDVNESNVLVANTALVTLVDTDSFQVQDPRVGRTYRCPVGKPEFTPPELQSVLFRDTDRSKEHDCFGLAVLIFKLLMEGTHPFDGLYTGAGEPPPLQQRILDGHYPHGTRRVPFRPRPIAPSVDLLPPAVRALMRACFEEGHVSPSARPDAHSWIRALDQAERRMKTCPTNAQHRFGDHLRRCPWCQRAALLQGADPFPSRSAVDAGTHLVPAARRRASPAMPPIPAPSPVAIPVTFAPATQRRVAHSAFRSGLRPPAALLSCLGMFACLAGLLYAGGIVASVRPTLAAPQNAAALVQTRVNPRDGAVMLWVPEGAFTMGSRGRADNPAHRTRLSGYWIYKYPVTVAQYRKFCLETDRPMPTAPGFDLQWSQKDHPIVNVSWIDARDYCRWAGVSLPTEAEWEHAARGPQGYAYPWGPRFDGGKLWTAPTRNGIGTASVLRAKRVSVSGYGCVDMAGNVMQWCADNYDARFWNSRSVFRDPLNSGFDMCKVLRGGSWTTVGADGVNAARRYSNLPESRSAAYGFRGAIEGSN